MTKNKNSTPLDTEKKMADNDDIPSSSFDLVYRSFGSPEAPKVILAHSICTDRRAWRGVALRLSEYFHVICPDMRGHGESAPLLAPYSFEELAMDVLGLAEAIGAKTFAFVGVSIGGMIGQQIALMAPERLSRLVLANTASRLADGSSQEWDARIETARNKGMLPLVEPIVKSWYDGSDAADDNDLKGFTASMVRRTSVEGFTGAAAVIKTLDFAPELKKIKAPTLVIAGEKDTCTFVEESRFIAQKIPNADYTEISGAGHQSALQKPHEFHKILLQHLSAF